MLGGVVEAVTGPVTRVARPSSLWVLCILGCAGSGCAGSPSEAGPLSSTDAPASTASSTSDAPATDATSGAPETETETAASGDGTAADSSGSPPLDSSTGVATTTDDASGSSSEGSSSGAAPPGVCDGNIAATCPCLTEMCCGSIEACAMNPQCGALIDCFEMGNPAVCVPSSVPPGGQPVIDCFGSQCGYSC